MKPGKIFLTGFVSMLLMAVSVSSRGDDTDLFLANPAITAEKPNVLIILDNTANWNTPFVAEKAALVSLVNGLEDDQFNVGLMMYTETGGLNKGPDGGYVRYAVRRMNSTNKPVLTNLVNTLDILNDKSNSGKAGLTMYEAYLYFAGKEAYAGGPPFNLDNGKVKSDNGTLLYPLDLFETGAFRTKISEHFKTPIIGGCQKNFIIYISNGPPQDTNVDTRRASDFLEALGGNIEMIQLNPSGSQSNISDEWARFMANNDVNTHVAGTQNVYVYTVDVLPGSTGQGPGWTALLKSMANQGKGSYFATSGDTSAITDALNAIFAQVQAVNSVFASSTLPVSVNVRGTYLNQVYMGVFRPDAYSSPRWAGNLKQYQLGVDNTTTPATLYLAGKDGVRAENAASGFIQPTARSFWTTASSFWEYPYYPESTQGEGGSSDLPDGDLVEKGGAAQRLRTVYATDQSSRHLYTCPAAGCSGALSGTLFDNTNVSSNQLGVATDTERDNIINWVRGANNQGDDNPSLSLTSIRGYVHGDALHSRPAVVNYNRDGQPTDRDIMVYYGSNDGIFHAVKGGQDDADGYEKWGFIMPEHFAQLKRLRDAVPLISTTNPKPYFADGPVSVYVKDVNNDGKLDAGVGDKVYLYIGMRRGGRFIYALDVSNPDAPAFLWKKSNADTGYGELGQTWSEPKVATIRGHTGPVLIFGLGYDATANDAMPAGTATMGRGVIIADAASGDPIWQAGPDPTRADRVVGGMTFSIAADLTVIDTNLDGFADRIYAADTGGNVWRINIDDGTGTNDPANWTVSKLAAVGGTGDARKFLYPPDVVYSAGYDAVLIGSGDREHPFDTTISNRYYMFKDSHALNATRSTPITEADMTDASTISTIPTTGPGSAGWYLPLVTAGEKVVGGSTTLRNSVYFATNVPSSSLPGDSCTSNLGEVRLYTINYMNAAPVNRNSEGQLVQYTVRPGGGYPPSPVPVIVQIGGVKYEAVIIGSGVVSPGSIPSDKRFRTFWFRD